MIREVILSMPDRKRHLCLLASVYISGVLAYNRVGAVWPVLVGIAGGGAVGIFIFIKNKKEAIVSLSLAVALFFLAFCHCMYDDRQYAYNQSQLPLGTESQITGILYKKEIKTNTYLYYLKKTRFGKIIVYTKEDSARIGSVVAAYGEMDAFPVARNEGNFNQAEYYRQMNIVCRMFADSVECKKEKKWDVREVLFRFQGRLSDVYERELNHRDAGVLCTLVLGNKSLLENEIRDMYQDAGISHILAISGLHISILGLGLFRFFRKLRFPYLFSTCVGSGTVAVFALMSGMAVSARRALVMFLVMMGAQQLGRAYDGVNALALAVILILSSQPVALYQSGFQFSCVSLVGIQFSIALFAKDTQELAEEVTGIVKRKRNGEAHTIWAKIKSFLITLKKNLISGAILQLFLLPLTAWHYYEVPLYSLFLNLMVLPLCSWLLGFGLLGGLVGLGFPEVSKWLLIVCHLILSFYEKLMETANLLPFSQVITGKPNPWILLPYYGTLVAFCLMVIARKSQSRTGG